MTTKLDVTAAKMTRERPRRIASGVYSAIPSIEAAEAREPDAIADVERIELAMLLEAIFRSNGSDFRSYAPSSLRRRVEKRREAEGLGSISALQDLVLHDTNAMGRLLGDLSISVTAMFRDPSFFTALRKRVVPLLRTYPFIRIWHAGCATGEEVYSLAILLEEEGLLGRARIYATDMNEDAVAAAKEGVFPLARLKEYAANYDGAGGKQRFSDYYAGTPRGARFAERLRENVLFAQHNLATDTGFSEFNLVLCRNVLIYFAAPLKDRALGLFTQSLSPFGLLALGRSESLRFTGAENEYDEVDGVERIYRVRSAAIASMR
jgi:chemotaxis protein methyltransferase CheR